MWPTDHGFHTNITGKHLSLNILDPSYCKLIDCVSILSKSATCRETYRLPDSLSVKKGEDEARALCTSEYSDISPLRDGNVAFSSLEGRPSAINFEHSVELQVNIETKKGIKCFELLTIHLCGSLELGNGHWDYDHFGSIEYIRWRSVWWSASVEIIFLCHCRYCGRCSMQM